MHSKVIYCGNIDSLSNNAPWVIYPFKSSSVKHPRQIPSSSWPTSFKSKFVNHSCRKTERYCTDFWPAVSSATEMDKIFLSLNTMPLWCLQSEMTVFFFFRFYKVLNLISDELLTKKREGYTCAFEIWSCRTNTSLMVETRHNFVEILKFSMYLQTIFNGIHFTGPEIPYSSCNIWNENMHRGYE